MSSSPTLAQVHFRFRTDNGAPDATPTWAVAEDTNYSVAVETLFRLRILAQNTGTATSTSPTVLRVSKNGGAYTAVTTSSGATLGAQGADASTSADSTSILEANFRLTPGAGTAFTGSYEEDGSSARAINVGNYVEFEFGLILKTAGAANGNTFDFRLYNNTTAFTTYTRTPRVTATVVDTEDDLLANNVISTSSVSPAPQLRQEHARLANDVKSNSSVSQPAMVIRRDLLANDVTSSSSVSQPNATIFAQTALLANDISSASSVTQPSVQQRQALLANDVKSNSSVGQPAVKALHGLLANDVTSASSVSVPAARQGHGVLANDVTSASSVSVPAIVVIAGQNALLATGVLSPSSVGQPAVHQVEGLSAENVTSASSVASPTLVIPVAGVDALNAADLTSLSSVGQPALQQTEGLLAENVISASFVLPLPSLVEIIGSVEQALLADNVISASFVSAPMVDRPEVVVPPETELGGGGKIYGRGYSRRRYEELLRELEAERREALQRAQAFPSNKDRQKARKAAHATSQAIAAAREAADEAAVIAHAGSIARTLEAATAAKSLVEYVERMKKAREEAVEMELDDDDEAILMLVA